MTRLPFEIVRPRLDLLPIEQLVASYRRRGYALVQVELLTDQVRFAPWWLAWLYRLVPRYWCWNPPSPHGPWLAPGIGAATWHVGYVRSAQSDRPEKGGYLTGRAFGRFWSWPARGEA